MQIARSRTEPGWRAAVLDERGSRHAFRLRASEEGMAFKRQAQRAERAMDRGASGGVLSSGSDDDGGGFACCAADLQEMAEQRSVPAPTKTAAT